MLKVCVTKARPRFWAFSLFQFLLAFLCHCPKICQLLTSKVWCYGNNWWHCNSFCEANYVKQPQHQCPIFYRGILGTVPKFCQVLYFAVQVYKGYFKLPILSWVFCRSEWFVLHRYQQSAQVYYIRKKVFGSVSRTRSFIWEHLVYLWAFTLRKAVLCIFYKKKFGLFLTYFVFGNR